MKNTLGVLVIIISVVAIMGGCAAKQDENSLLTDDDTGLADSIINEEFERTDILKLAELKNLLGTSSNIEVKNIENQTIGQINTSEKISKVIGDIFSYTIVDNYKKFSDEDVVATINFYLPGNQPIYGLIKEKFIYIEGYYFTSNSSSIQKMVEYFRINTEEDPIVGD